MCYMYVVAKARGKGAREAKAASYRSVRGRYCPTAAPEDTVSGSKCPGMVMIEVALRKQLWATVKGESRCHEQTVPRSRPECEASHASGPRDPIFLDCEVFKEDLRKVHFRRI
jgi:hypothetical protein